MILSQTKHRRRILSVREMFSVYHHKPNYAENRQFKIHFFVFSEGTIDRLQPLHTAHTLVKHFKWCFILKYERRITRWSSWRHTVPNWCLIEKYVLYSTRSYLFCKSVCINSCVVHPFCTFLCRSVRLNCPNINMTLVIHMFFFSRRYGSIDQLSVVITLHFIRIIW